MRVCETCGKVNLFSGYCFDDGEAYYCSDGCLSVVFTPEEWEEIYNNDQGYWTEWEEGGEEE